MNASRLELALLSAAAQVDADAKLDQALQRQGLLQLVRQRRHELARLRDLSCISDDISGTDIGDAEMRLAMAQASLESFDRLVADRAVMRRDNPEEGT